MYANETIFIRMDSSIASSSLMNHAFKRKRSKSKHSKKKSSPPKREKIEQFKIAVAIDDLLKIDVCAGLAFSGSQMDQIKKSDQAFRPKCMKLPF